MLCNGLLLIHLQGTRLVWQSPIDLANETISLLSQLGEDTAVATEAGGEDNHVRLPAF